MSPLSSRQLNLSVLAVIAAVALIAYSNSFQVPFVYDDLGNISQNPALKTFNFFDWRSYAGLRALPQASFALQTQFGFSEPWHFHAINLAIHIVNAWLVYWLCLLLGRHFIAGASLTPGVSPAAVSPAPAFLPALFAALIFVAHPIATEAVTYIVQRTVSLTTLFYLLAVVSYVQWRRASLTPNFARRATLGRLGDDSNPNLALPAEALAEAGVSPARRLAWATISLIATVAAMHSKQIAVTLPLAILLVEVLF